MPSVTTSCISSISATIKSTNRSRAALRRKSRLVRIACLQIFASTSARNRLIAIREERPNGDVIKAIHTLVAIDIATGREATLDSGYDFYSSPTLNVDGSKLAWLSWQHPNMPWTSTYLNVAGLDQAGTLTDKQIVQGGSESLFQPQWSPDGKLYFISDRTDFWNLYRWNASGVERVLARDAEFGVPQWHPRSLDLRVYVTQIF